MEMYREYLKNLFSSDKDFLMDFHNHNNLSLEECVDITLDCFKKASNFKLFEIKIDNKNIGFFGKEIYNNKEFLTGFFIKPEFRKKETINKVVKDFIYPNFNNGFFCGIYSKNKKAMKFIEKIGGISLSEDSQKKVYIIFKENI